MSDHLPTSAGEDRVDFQKTQKLSSRVFCIANHRIASFACTDYDKAFRRVIAKYQEAINHLRNPKLARDELQLRRRELGSRLRNLLSQGFNVDEICEDIREKARDAIKFENALWRMLKSDEVDDDEDGDEEDEKDAARFEGAESVIASFKTRVTSLIDEGIVDKDIATLFLSAVSIKYPEDGDHYHGIAYQMLTGKNGLEDDQFQKRDKSYRSKLAQLRRKYPDRARLDKKKHWVHFNKGRQKKATAYRVYVSPKLTEFPSKVIDAFTNVMMANMPDIHFKIHNGLSDRDDQVTVYLSSVDVEQFELALQKFRARCPDKLLSDSNIPGVNLGPGLSFGPEPAIINDVLTEFKEELSYNQLLSIITLAYSFAYNDKFKEAQNSEYTLQDLEQTASKYFEQMIEISGINPETMMLRDVNNGKLPEWVKKYV